MDGSNFHLLISPYIYIYVCGTYPYVYYAAARVCPEEGCGESFLTWTEYRRHLSEHKKQKHPLPLAPKEKRFFCDHEGCVASYTAVGHLA